jgi:hypothetical protein
MPQLTAGAYVAIKTPTTLRNRWENVGLKVHSPSPHPLADLFGGWWADAGNGNPVFSHQLF